MYNKTAKTTKVDVNKAGSNSRHDRNAKLFASENLTRNRYIQIWIFLGLNEVCRVKGATQLEGQKFGTTKKVNQNLI